MMARRLQIATVNALILLMMCTPKTTLTFGGISPLWQEDQAAKKQKTEIQKKLKVAQRQFYSGDPEARQQAKQTFIEIGTESFPTLLSLMNGPDRRYRRLISKEETSDLKAILLSFPIDTTVPYFIKIMEETSVDSLIENISSDKQALILIGSPAVPYLIDLLQNVNQRLTGSVVKEEDRIVLHAEIVKIIKRVSLVLGEIGDDRAVEPLHKLLEPTNDPSITKYIKWEVENALEKIEKKSHSN